MIRSESTEPASGQSLDQVLNQWLSSPAAVQCCSDQCNPTAPAHNLDLEDHIYHSPVSVRSPLSCSHASVQRKWTKAVWTYQRSGTLQAFIKGASSHHTGFDCAESLEEWLCHVVGELTSAWPSALPVSRQHLNLSFPIRIFNETSRTVMHTFWT